MECTVISDGLLVGGAPHTTDDIGRLRAEARVTAVLSLQHDDDLHQNRIDYPALVRYGQTLGLTLTRCPLRDHDPADQQRGLLGAVRALYALRQQGDRVYVHCTLGVSRAPRVVLAYLTWIEGLSLEAALRVLQRARPRAFPCGPAYFAVHDALVAQHADRIRQRLREHGEWSPGGSDDDPPTDSVAWRQAVLAVVREVLTAPEDPSPAG